MTDLRARIYLAYELLHYGYTSLLILCGIDKFFLVLTDWTKYQSQAALQMTHLSPHELLIACGLIEIILGILAAFYPKAGSAFIGLWLLAITINLLMLPDDYYIALLNLILAAGAFAMNFLCSSLGKMQTVLDTPSPNNEEYHI
jgi:hypothetical protein